MALCHCFTHSSQSVPGQSPEDGQMNWLIVPSSCRNRGRRGSPIYFTSGEEKRTPKR